MATSLRVLGSIELELDDQPVPLGGRRERALLTALLLARGQVVSVDRLAEDLWEGDPPAKASSALRVHVSRLRKALAEAGQPDALVTRAPGYALALDGVETDADEMERLAGAGRKLLEDRNPREAGSVLRQALALWGGPPFAELAETDFTRAEVQHLEDIYCTAQEDRVEADLLLGRHLELTAELELLVRRYPTRERLWGQRMLALYRSGRQSEALAAYRDLRTQLADALGIDPSPALQQLEVAILCHDPVLDLAATRGVSREPTESGVSDLVEPPAVSGTGIDPLDDGPDEPIPLPSGMTGVLDADFVGRAVELDRLDRAWARCVAGERHRVFLAGEPGIGKSTLAAAMAVRAAATGGTVLLGCCDDDALTPYQPFVEALRRYVHSCSAAVLARRSRADLAEICRLVPELGERVPGLEAPVDRGDADRLRLFEAVGSFLEAASVEHPVLLVLEDLHWADRPTILMLRHVARRTEPARVFVLGTYRDVDLTPSHPLTDLLADLRRDQLGERFQLRGLDPAEVASMLRAEAGDALGTDGPNLAGALHRDTGGNPFFLREVVRHLRAQVVDASGWLTRLRSGELGLPESVREVVGRRITALTEDANRVLAAAAVAGVTFSVELVEAVTELPAETVLDGAEQAAEAGLITEVERQPGWFAFTHALNREVIYSSLSTVRRLRLHRLVGEELERRSFSATPVTDRTLAYHFLEAGAAGGAQDKAIEYCTRAGEAAMAQLAYEEAAVHYERALEVVADADPDNAGLTIDLLLRLGHVHWRAGATAMAPTFERAAALAREAGDRPRFAEAVVGLGQSAGGFAGSVRANDTLISLITEALEWLGPEEDALRVRLVARLATELYFTPSWPRGWDLSREALTTAEALGDPEVLLVAQHAEAWATFAPDEAPTTRLAKADAVLRLALQVDDLEIAYRAEFLRQQTLLEIGDFAGADEALQQVEHLVRELRMPRFVPWVRSYQATRAFVAGELAQADDLSARALADLGDESSEGAVALIGGQQMALRIYRDGLEPMAEFLEAMVDDMSFQNVVRAMLPVLYHELDRSDDAVVAWRNAVADLHDVPRDVARLVYMWALGSTCRFAGGVDRAEELYQLVLPFADRWAVATSSICFGPMAQPLGVLASTLGWHEVAFTHLENAVAHARAVPAPVFEASAEVELAHALLASELRSVRDRAGALLDHARERCEALGLTSLRTRVDRLSATLP